MNTTAKRKKTGGQRRADSIDVSLAASVRAAIRAKARGGTTVSVIDAGELLGLGRDASYRAVEEGRIPTLRTCERRLRVSVAVLERMLLGENA